MKLPKADQAAQAWQTAIRCLIGAAEGRDFMMHARIGMMRALDHRPHNPPTTPRGKRAKAYRIVR
jgi:hypothetical protein